MTHPVDFLSNRHDVGVGIGDSARLPARRRRRFARARGGQCESRQIWECVMEMAKGRTKIPPSLWFPFPRLHAISPMAIDSGETLTLAYYVLSASHDGFGFIPDFDIRQAGTRSFQYSPE